MAGARESSVHTNCTPAAESLKLNVAVEAEVEFAGPRTIIGAAVTMLIRITRAELMRQL
jgi:hypothetical protein